MQRSHRVLVAIVILLAGTGAFIFAGGKVAGCLGPLGVTPIQCAKVTGIIPTIGLVGAPIILLSATATIFGGWAQTSSAGVLCALPVAVWEFSLGVWLVVKGFKTTPAVA